MENKSGFFRPLQWGPRGMVPVSLLRCAAVGAGYTRPGNVTAAIRLPGRRIRRPYDQPIHRQFLSAGSRPRPTGEPQMYHYGGSGTPESTVENRKNRWKNSLSRRFSRFFRFDFSFGGLGGVQPQSRAPRLGMRGFLPAGLCPAIAPTEYSAMQKPTRSVGSPVHGCSRPRNRGHWAGCLT